jgi:hypothetical protein
MLLIGYPFISCTKLLLYWQCGFVIRMVVPIIVIQRSSGCHYAKCPTNWSRFPPSVTYCVAASMIVLIGLDEFARIVMLVTCYTWNTRKPMES